MPSVGGQVTTFLVIASICILMPLVVGCGGNGGGGGAPIGDTTQGAILTGTVTDATTGNPVQNALVEAVGITGKQAWTNAQGVFSITGLPVGQEIQIRVSATGYNTQSILMVLNQGFNQTSIALSPSTGGGTELPPPPPQF